MTRYRWAAWGDLNAFFGLMLDNIAVLVLLVSTLTIGERAFTPRFVLERMVPGTALGVLVGDLAYTALAFRLARRSGKSDVTAMPLGLDTPRTCCSCGMRGHSCFILPSVRWLRYATSSPSSGVLGMRSKGVSSSNRPLVSLNRCTRSFARVVR